MLCRVWSSIIVSVRRVFVSDQATVTCGCGSDDAQPPLYSEYSLNKAAPAADVGSTLQHCSECLQHRRLMCTLRWHDNEMIAPDNIQMMITVTSLMPQTPGLSQVHSPGAAFRHVSSEELSHVVWRVTCNAAASLTVAHWPEITKYKEQKCVSKYSMHSISNGKVCGSIYYMT